MQKNVILIILDGWGHGKKPEVSAIAKANTPFINSLYKNYPNAELVTYGEDVGLPEGQMGNSEVGHLNIGAGRVVYQELARINKAIREKTLHQDPTLLEALTYAKEHNKHVHLMGLVSDGGVHSHINHLKALCDITEEQGLENVFIHAFTDGRDTAPKGGVEYMKNLLKHLEGKKAKVASICGRYYAMDRDKRWERIKLAYDLLVKGQGEKIKDIPAAIQSCYEKGLTDEFLTPLVCTDDNGQILTTIKEDDVVICFNFRTDRPREISQVLTQEDMPDFDMQKLNLHYVTMTRYDETFKNVHVIFNKEDISNTLGEILERNNMTQVRIAETEKYPHVTFFFSGGREKEFKDERRIVIPSPKVATYDLKPEMSAYELTDTTIKEMNTRQPNFICLNYANTDMVGHTGVFEAAVKAAEVVDECLQKLLSNAMQKDYVAIVIADHGNSDFMINEDGTPHTAHTKNLVPCIYVTKRLGNKKVKNGKLADIAPTILAIMDIEKPEAMDGENLIY